MEAERGTNACAAADHADQMRKLHAYVLELQTTQPKFTVRMVLESQYYVLESDIDQVAE